MGVSDRNVFEVDGTIRLSAAGQAEVVEHMGFRESWKSLVHMRVDLATAGSSFTGPRVADQGDIRFLAVSGQHPWRMKISGYGSTSPCNCRGLFIGQVNSSSAILTFYNGQSASNTLDIIIGQRGIDLTT